jgi:hypothetical protein
MEIGNPEVDVGEGVSAVDHHQDSLAVRHVRDLPHGQDLAGDVDHVADHEQPGLRRDGVGVEPHDLLVRLRVEGQGHELVDQAVAPGLEREHVEHRPIVLRCHHRFVSGLPVEAGDDGVE